MVQKLGLLCLELGLIFFSSCASRHIDTDIFGEQDSVVNTLNSIGWEFYKQGRYLDAEAFFSLSLQLSPDCMEAHLVRSATYNRLKESQQALADANAILSVYPHHLGALNNRANVYVNLKEFKLALKDYKLIYRLNPNFWETLYNIAILEHRLHYRREAVKYYTKSIKIKPNFVRAYIFRGQVLYELGKRKAGLQDLLTAEQMPEISTQEVLLLVGVYNKVKQYSKAQDLMNKICADNPQAIAAYKAYGQTMPDTSPNAKR